MEFIIPGIVIAALAILFYMFAVASRRTYKCPQCGEEITTEHLDAKRCGMCGAPLEEKGH